MKYKLTLTNELGEALGDWGVVTDQTYTDDCEDSGCNIDKRLASEELLADIVMTIDMSDRADKEADEFRTGEKKGQRHGPQPKHGLVIAAKKTWIELRGEYLAIMDSDREIAQKWQTRSIDWRAAKDTIAENQKKRNVIINQMDAINKGK